MIIQIPLQIDEHQMEDVLKRDYEQKVMGKIVDYIKTTLSKRARTLYGDKVDDGMRALIEMRIDEFLKDNKNAVIEAAANTLADKLARSKRGKEILERLSDE